MRFHDLLWALAALLLFVVPGASQDQPLAPSIPGLAGQHPLDEEAEGRLLLGELRCASCHHELAAIAPAPPGPDLSDVSARVRSPYLGRFLAAPREAQPGTKMPDLTGALPAAEREEVADALAHFLRMRSSGLVSDSPFDEERAARGEDLFHTVGCVACHAPRRPPELSTELPPPGGDAVPLGHVADKYSIASLAEFLFQPGLTRPAGRMPDMGLSREEALDLAGYLVGPGGFPNAYQLDSEAAAEGRKHFEALNCAACHATEGISPAASVPIADTSAGCLDAESSAGASYALDGRQRAALARALSAERTPPSVDEHIASTLTAFNCIACHEREEYGGVRPELDPYFTTDEHDLGDDARIPPPLTLAGAKLEGEWLRKVVYDGASARDYMFTRMPRFGEEVVGHLPALLERADAGRVEPFPLQTFTGPELHEKKEAGRQLMGNKGLGCILCHDFNGTPSPIHEGIDLVNSTTRLQPDWFARFLIDPAGYRPGVVMPESWSGGVASHKGILDGDTEAQISALWAFLAQGRTARMPDGIRPEPSQLFVGDAPRLYRGRSRVAGFRGIAVGSPEGVHYAFDAQNGALAALWRGDFVTARWGSQGAGDFDPLGRPVQLARDVAFLRGADEASPWPLRPVTTEDEPINPDPTYPRNHGYRFRGYDLGADSVPVLRYASGDVDIRDRGEALGGEGRAGLRRTLTFTAPAAERLSFRVLAGDFEEVSERVFRAKGVLLRLPDVPILRRVPGGDDHPDDVLLQLDLPQGESSLTIDYELLD